MTEEEEAATTACTFTCFEDLVTIVSWAQASFNDTNIVVVLFERLHEDLTLVESYLDVWLVGHWSIIFRRSCLWYTIFLPVIC